MWQENSYFVVRRNTCDITYKTKFVVVVIQQTHVNDAGKLSQQYPQGKQGFEQKQNRKTSETENNPKAAYKLMPTKLTQMTR